MIQDFLAQLGFSGKEQAILLVLAEIGIQPASAVARRANLDRVTTYKHLKKLAEQGFVKTYARDSVQCFGLESTEGIEALVKERARTMNDLVGRLPTALELLRSLKSGSDVVPKIALFEGETGIKSLYRDMLQEVKASRIRQIRMLNVNTFTEWMGDEPLAKIVRSFFQDLRVMKVDVQFFEVTGGLVPEQMTERDFRTMDLGSITIARGTTNIFLIGRVVYLACTKGNQMGLKIAQAELGQIFHFLFDRL